MIVLVCGGRYFADADLLYRTLLDLRSKSDSVWTAIVHGGARGADSLAGQYAREIGIQEIIFPAMWSAYGRSAGSRRNEKMLEMMKPDLVVAFPGGRGTCDTVRRTEKKGIRLVVVSYG